MAFIQFHPTALALEGERPFLITEALRGEGGVILDGNGLKKWQKDGAKNPETFSFTLNYSPLGSMATRDLVARSIDIVMKKNGSSNVYLVTSHLNQEELEENFPNIKSRLSRYNLTLGVDNLPVAPAAHYIVGGLKVDIFGRPYLRNSNEVMPNLFAIGEVACTGMHGANRLASNSLLEAVVYANNAAKHIIANPPNTMSDILPDWRADGLKFLSEHSPIVSDLTLLKDTMSTEVGIVRNFARLERANRRIKLLTKEVDLIWKNSIPTREIVELRNLIQVGILITEDALNRKENRGLHYNTDLI